MMEILKEWDDPEEDSFDQDDDLDDWDLWGRAP